MRPLSARIRGLSGIYTKSNKKEIYIDFTKCKHNIIYIIGKNGSGKSTLMSVLTPLPDSPQMYLDKEPGEKELSYTVDGSIIYDILIQYPVHANGTRATTKAFFREIHPDGNVVECNPNGTVGSFKEILYAKFNLDPNFEALSQLSTEDRGIVEKKPSERKKFVIGLLESIDVYNDIYKTLVKRSGVFKSMINSITSKIDSIGNEQKLITDQVVVDNRVQKLSSQLDGLKSMVSAATATIKLIDPDNAIQNKYKDLHQELLEVQHDIATLSQVLTSDLDTALQNHLTLNTRLAELKSEVDKCNYKITVLVENRNNRAKELFEKNIQYQELSSDENAADIKLTLANYKNRVFKYEEIFKSIGISIDSITKDEYILAIQTLDDIRSTVTNIRSQSEERAIITACDAILSNVNLPEQYQNTLAELESIKESINQIKEKIGYYNGLLNRLDILNGRPEECSIDSCSFIRDALNAQSENPQKHLEQLSEELDQLQEKQIKIAQNSNFYEEALYIYYSLTNLTRSISNNKIIINKLPIGKNFTDINVFIERVRNGDLFNDINETSDSLDYANMIELYKSEKQVVNNLELRYKELQSTETTLKQLKKDIDSITEALSKIDEEVSSIRSDILEMNNEIASLSAQISILDNEIIKYRRLDELKKEETDLQNRLRAISENISKISNEINNINTFNSQIKNIEDELIPLSKNRDDIVYSLHKLQEYKVELDEFNKKYEMIEILKKYSSPTKGGIQTIFMELYLNKTLELSNQLLSMLFDGELELLPYIINESEFRIPVRNNISGLVNYDISNCSTSEKCMISMILGFSLMFHSSPIYNIIKLDEIDGGLDQANKAVFPVILDKIMNILGVETCFIISHSSESDLSNVDIIKLTPVNNETPNGNIIFDLNAM